MDPKLAFNLYPSAPHTAALIDIITNQLWIVHTIEQYAEVDRHSGTFQHETLRLPGAALFSGTVPAQQHLSGIAATIMTVALLELIQSGQPNFGARVQSGIVSNNWRTSGDSATVVTGKASAGIFFAVVYSLGQLRQLQRQYFPKEPQRVLAFQSVARLPESSDTIEFIVTGDVAVACLQGCLLSGHLRFG